VSLFQRRVQLQGLIMNGMQKVLVVDNGDRDADCALSAELAGLGYASVTAHLEAADDVLALIPSPAAVVLQMPRQADWLERRRFLELATRLRRTLASSRTPVIVTGGVNGAVAMLQNELGSRAVAAPEL
jgi:CheY-like chemotaxis protein